MEDWNFKDNMLWQNMFEMCNPRSKNGSPINIESNTIEECKLSCELKFENKPSKAHLKFRNNMVSLKYDEGSKLIFLADLIITALTAKPVAQTKPKKFPKKSPESTAS